MCSSLTPLVACEFRFGIPYVFSFEASTSFALLYVFLVRHTRGSPTPTRLSSACAFNAGCLFIFALFIYFRHKNHVPPLRPLENCSLVVHVAPNFPRASSRPVGARVERTRREDRPARGRPGGSARSADALRQMRRTTRPTRALRAPRDPRRWAQGAPPPGSRDLRLLAVRESPEADAAWVHHMTDAGHVEPVRPLALGAGRAVAWPAAHATVRVPCPTPRRRSMVS